MAPTSTPAARPAHTLVAVEGRLTSGDLFSFQTAHYTGESEFDLADRVKEAFDVYRLDVESYKIDL